MFDSILSHCGALSIHFRSVGPHISISQGKTSRCAGFWDFVQPVWTVHKSRLFRRAAFTVHLSGGKTSFFVRKALWVRPRDQETRERFSARREGLTLFDEDDVCAGFWDFRAACLNCSFVPQRALRRGHKNSSAET